MCSGYSAWALLLRLGAEQSGGEFAPAIPTTGARDAAFPTNAKSAAVRLRPRLGLQPFQLGAQSLLKGQLEVPLDL